MIVRYRFRDEEILDRQFYIVVESDCEDMPVGETFSDDDLSMAGSSSEIEFIEVD